MKRIVLLIVTFAAICCYGQGRANKANKNIEKLIDEAFVRGTNVDSVYWLFNNENKSLTANDICCYLQRKGFYPLTYTEKNILKCVCVCVYIYILKIMETSTLSLFIS